jgi:hypothetical protein
MPFAGEPPGAVRKHTHARCKFTLEEDDKLRTLVSQFGTRHWESIAQYLPGRTARQCRDRYKNYLLESLVAAPWSADEDQLLRQKFAQIGPRWVEISKLLHGRSGNDVKNRWHKHLAKWTPTPVLPKLPPINQTAAQLPAALPLLASHPAQAAPQLYPCPNPAVPPPFRNSLF